MVAPSTFSLAWSSLQIPGPGRKRPEVRRTNRLPLARREVRLRRSDPRTRLHFTPCQCTVSVTRWARPSAKPTFHQLAGSEPYICPNFVGAYIGLSARSSAKLRFGRARAHLGLPAALLGPSGPDSESSKWDPYDNMGDLVETTRLTLRCERCKKNEFEHHSVFIKKPASRV